MEKVLGAVAPADIASRAAAPAARLSCEMALFRAPAPRTSAPSSQAIRPPIRRTPLRNR